MAIDLTKIKDRDVVEFLYQLLVTGESGPIAFAGGNITLDDTEGVVEAQSPDGLHNLALGSTNTVANFGNGQDVNIDLYRNNVTLATLTADGLSMAAGKNVLLATHTPSSATDTGVTGTITWDASFIYICYSTDHWAKVAIAAW